ncbi:MAG: iron-sulfur cluster repair di-iron protein, ric [Firmicutes bacterium]|nr:iron-sulfur cluster repair di-iron protein, ric [Bacillota bacterium]
MTIFNAVKEQHLDKLELYVPVVARVHGGTHPEFHEVHKIFDQMFAKIKAAGEAKPKLDSEFQELRTITNDYEVPDDVCETYEAVYLILAELDRAYHA